MIASELKFNQYCRKKAGILEQQLLFVIEK